MFEFLVLSWLYYFLAQWQVGIGNTFGGYTSALQQALRENRTLVVTSRILQKFCVLVPCALEPLDAEDGHFKPKKDADVKRNTDYFFKVDGYPRGADGLALEPFYDLAGCKLPNPAGEWDDLGWRHRCLYSRLIRSLIVGGDSKSGKLMQEKEWLRRYYVGDKSRFDRVMAVNKHPSEPIFDYVIHVRTLGLIEDMRNKDGLPSDPEGKTISFLASEGFEQMLSCFSHEIASSVSDYLKSGNRFKDRARNEVRIYVATDAAGIRQSFSDRLQKAVADCLNSGSGSKDVEDVEEAASRGVKWSHRLGNGAVSPANNGTARKHGFIRRQRLASGATSISLETSDLRHQERKLLNEVESARALRQRRLTTIGNESSVSMRTWAVSVDYFTHEIPPAHFWIWTTPVNQMTEKNWQRLSGTTAEWLFMSQGRTMLTVKGLKGGERALPSSFAMSAAAFGEVKFVKFLRSSKTDRHGQCDMAEISSFS